MEAPIVRPHLILISANPNSQIFRYSEAAGAMTDKLLTELPVMDQSKEEWQHDWYGILGVEPGSSKELIEKAARKLAAKNHPDKTSDPEAPAKFLLIQKAKEILTDDSKKKAIDDHYAQSKKRKEYDENRWKGADEQRKKFRDALDSKINQEAQRKTTIDPNEILKEEIKKQTKVMAEMKKKNREMMDAAYVQEQERLAKKEADYLAYRKSLAQESLSKARQVKFKWKRSAQSQSEDSLYFLMKQFGEVEEVSLVGSKGTMAVITFLTEESAKRAIEFYADSPDYRVSFLVEDKPREKAKVFTHQFTQSHEVNEDLSKEVNKFREQAHLAEMGYTAPIGVTEDVRGSDGKVDLQKFLEKERRILEELRNFGPPQTHG